MEVSQLPRLDFGTSNHLSSSAPLFEYEDNSRATDLNTVTLTDSKTSAFSTSHTAGQPDVSKMNRAKNDVEEGEKRGETQVDVG